MNFNDALGGLLGHLQQIREESGEEAYQLECRTCALEFVHQGPKGEQFARKVFPDLDFDTLKNPEPAPEPPPAPVQGTEAATPAEVDGMFVKALQLSMPGLRTQAQFNAFSAAFDALRTAANGIFERDVTKALQGREALLKALDTLDTVTDVSEKLREVPEAATSAAAEEFKRPPSEFGEYDLQKQLFTELSILATTEDLVIWYTENRGRIDKVRSQTLRNGLLDAIREKKVYLSVPRTTPET
jgi:hypothetical protein